MSSRKRDDDEVETSDDDFVDPSMDKYFKKPSNDKKEKQTSKKVINFFEDDGKDDYGEDDEDDDEDEGDIDEPSDQEESDDVNDDEKTDTNAANDDEQESDGRKMLTNKIVNTWARKLAQENPYHTINEVVKAFKSALLNVIPGKKSVDSSSYRVEGPDMFNAMVRLCIRDLVPCFLRLLNLSSSSKKEKTDGNESKIKLPTSGSNWRRLKTPIKCYLTDLLNLASNIHEADILNAILRHIRILINFYLCFPKLLKSLIKYLITTWSQGDEKSRVIAFICLHKITANTHEKNQDIIFKNLYLSFARNSKFTSINTLPLINFMQRSLIEIYSVNQKLAYEHVFVYVRQLAIHLRNAMNLKKKESYQAVYNWQYVHSLVLWSKLLSSILNTIDSRSNAFEFLSQLVYPVIQCLIGTIKLIPTPRYYPLRFHCINALTLLSNSTNTFVPIIPFILEIFDITDFNKKHATISVKNINFSFLLKLNKQQLQDKSFKDVVIDNIYDSLILLLQNQSNDIAFPELVLPLTIRLKDFTKKCKNPSYCKVVKGLLEKIQENTKFIEEKRSKVTFSLRDKKEVDLWTAKIKEQGTPLTQWYTRYKTLRERELMMEASNKEYISKNKVQAPVIEKPKVSSEQREAEKREFGELFVNLSDEDSDTELLDFVPKKKQKTQDSEEEPMEEDDDDEEDEDDDEDDSNADDDDDDDKSEDDSKKNPKKRSEKKGRT